MAPEVEAHRSRHPAPVGFRRLRVEDVGFTYPGASTPAVTEVSMEIGAGEIVALVGENGSGKTTLAKLLCRLYLPQRGRVLWDEVDTATTDPDGLRRSVAVIFQDFLHYALPASENIGMGRHQRIDDAEAIRGAALHAGADDFLAKLPSGYETVLGPEFEGGKELSVGQWQRVALARAFFRDAPFIILDEPTAALDARAEHELFESIRTLCRGRSVLLISHRFSSVRSADRIYVLDGGRVVESGSHQELMDLGGRYADLFALQASAYLASG
jgi:ATP-binding cassette, subfamily B, bacterial